VSDLTVFSARRRIDMMVVYRAGQLVALLLAGLVGGSPLASCMAASESEVAMACCAAADRDCLPGTKVECCEQTTSRSPQQFATTGTLKSSARQLAVVFVAAADPLVVVPLTRARPFSDAGSSPGSKHSIYLALSTLRL